VTVGVVVMSYGTPSRPEQIPEYYTDILHGRPPTIEQLAELERRYAAIGGLSPLNSVSRAQMAGITAALERLAPSGFRTAYGTKHAWPRIAEAAGELVASGVDALVGLVLTPHFSTLSVEQYFEQLAEAAAAAGLPLGRVERWGADPVLVELLAERVRSSLEELGTPARWAEVLFTAHSLPTRILAAGDPYPAELAETAALVAAEADLTRFRTAWQSASVTPEPWLGPDIGEVLEELAGVGTEGVVVCPAGFVSDHLEILYDLDVVARRRAEGLKIAFARTASLNDEPRLMEALAGLVIAAVPPR